MVTETINFRYGAKHKKKKVHFCIVHNLSDNGLKLSDAFDNWVERCDDPTNQVDFIEYIISNDPINIKAHAI